MKRCYLLSWQFIIILLVIVLDGCTALPTPSRPPATSAAVVTPTPECPTFDISGRITNLDQAMPFLSQTSYLQLVSAPAQPPSSQVPLSLQYFPDQTTAISSDLAQIPIPSDGNFHFRVNNLEPGRYLVAVQRVRNQRLANGYYAPMSLTTNGTIVSIVPVIQGVHFACRWDMGNIVIGGYS